MKVTQTNDVDYISEVLSSDGVSESVWDDGGPIDLPIHPELHYLIPSMELWDEGSVSDVKIGCMAFAPVNTITWNPHIAILSQFRGKGTEAMQAGIDWMFENTACKKLIAFPPEYNQTMIRVFEKCGFSFEGYSPFSVLKKGVLHGRYMMGRSK